MPTNNPHHRPILPVELNYQILEETWRLPLSTTERRDLLVTLPLVCTSFRCIASRLFLQDAHVVSPAYATNFLSFLLRRRDQPADSDLDANGSSLSVDPRHRSSNCCCCCCRSITFHIYDPTSSPEHLHLNIPSSNPTTHALKTTLHALSLDASLAPALRRVALHYTGCSFTHELSHARLASLPPHVRTLELHFATPTLYAPHLRQIYPRHYALPMPGVRSLRIFGTCPAFVADVARACPALESLETDVPGEEVFALQPSLRPFLALGVTRGDGVRAKECAGTGTVVVGHETKTRNEERSGSTRAKYQTRTRVRKRGARGDA